MCRNPKAVAECKSETVLVILAGKLDDEGYEACAARVKSNILEAGNVPNSQEERNHRGTHDSPAVNTSSYYGGGGMKMTLQAGISLVDQARQAMPARVVEIKDTLSKSFQTACLIEVQYRCTSAFFLRLWTPWPTTSSPRTHTCAAKPRAGNAWILKRVQRRS